ncbi:NAD(P)/FAD-dependent oxidoreductase [Aspergillus affinis]|uniref:NAD(P)/FAD-dependent oxidoreductase n=1 Tax=Aspergillus affinis TaxID=1070780 RepID=UPI0022FE1F24|nr:tryptophan 2-halogenase [Aspergillus affinis]KAI9046065.1 tryptophan 2-halogenase [Aspergillus affinis]
MNTDGHHVDTDFISAGGPDNYTWNLVRSEADHLVFQHARECGSTVIDGIRVDALQFTHADAPYSDTDSYSEELGFTRPVSATYIRKSDGKTGSIDFQYVVDASGRAGMINTKCRKDRRYSKILKNSAHLCYWSGAKEYAVGTDSENSSYFEALYDESGWAWMIPLHDGTVFVGIVQNQEMGNARKRDLPADGSTQDFYMNSLRLAPNITDMLSNARCETSVRSASDYSYSSASYAIPYARVVGDAGCFIDPFFSSGVHLALTGALSAAMTICAALRHDCDEKTAAAWHSTKVGDAYMRFLLVVLSAYRQMWRQDASVWSEIATDNFDKAFDCVQPIIQGAADADPVVTSERVSRALDFCSHAVNTAQPDVKARLRHKHATDSATVEEGDALKHL